MNKQFRAIVLLYNGPEITVEGVKNVSEYVATLLATEMPVAYSLDENDLAKLAVAKASTLLTSDDVNKVDLLGKTPAEHAIIYIGTKFESVLSARNNIGFATELSAFVATARFTGADDKLIEAVKIIATNPISTVRESIRRKYHINTQIYDIIQRIGNNV